ncbi:MAG: TonB-dependent receptor [Deltaproteobacteria bacterium]
MRDRVSFFLVVLGLGLLLVSPALAAGPALLDAVEDRTDVGGFADELDASPAQEELVAEGKKVPGITKRREARLEEIVVTARKRSEALEDTPVSVSALSENTLLETGVLSLQDIQKLVPNLQITTGRSGQSAGISIRGIGTATGDLAFGQGVGLYIDGVYLPRALGSIVDIVDVSQIEVLRGPQGTLFGKNTVGGAINITTQKPGEYVSGSALVRFGNFGLVHTKAMLNLPVDIGWFEDKLFSRVSFVSSNDDGYVKNAGAGKASSNRNSINFLGSLRFLPTAGVTVDLTGTWSRSHTRGRGGQCIYVRDGNFAGLEPADFKGDDGNCSSTTPLRNQPFPNGLADVESYGMWGTATWDVSEMMDVPGLDDFTIKLIPAWREQIPRIIDDIDNTEDIVLQIASAGGAPELGEPGFQRQFSGDLQFIGSVGEGRGSFVVGAFGMREDAETHSAIWVLPDTFNFSNTDYISITNVDAAFYGQGSYDLTEWANVTAGLRWTQERKKIAKLQFSTFNPEAIGIDARNQATFTAWTPMVSLALTMPEEYWDGTPVEHLMGYFTYSQGFKAGGFNATVGSQGTDLEQFAPEYLDSWELGVKAVAFDRRLTMNTSFFFGDYRDLQVATISARPDEDGDGLPEFTRSVRNAGTATTRGLEFEVVAAPIDGLRIMGSVGLVRGVYTEFIGEDGYTGDAVDRSGQTFNNIPELQTNISLQYSLPVPAFGPAWTEGWFTSYMDWSYRSSVHYGPPEVEPGIQPGFSLVDIRFSYDFLGEQAQVALWTKNVLDVENHTGGGALVQLFGFVSRYYNPPRTFGAEVSYRF